jgi:hypothetical protein
MAAMRRAIVAFLVAFALLPAAARAADGSPSDSGLQPSAPCADIQCAGPTGEPDTAEPGTAGQDRSRRQAGPLEENQNLADWALVGLLVLLVLVVPALLLRQRAADRPEPDAVEGHVLRLVAEEAAPPTTPVP